MAKEPLLVAEKEEVNFLLSTIETNTIAYISARIFLKEELHELYKRTFMIRTSNTCLPAGLKEVFHKFIYIYGFVS